jgi:4-hydroxy-3-polyprenylbenzoate decarboxylase
MAINIQPGKHAQMMLKRYQELGKKMPAAVCIGQLPILFFLSSVGIPCGVSEYDAAGGFCQEPAEVIKSDLTGLLVPATAEYVLEGEIDPDPSTYKPEEPFGEYTGDY